MSTEKDLRDALRDLADLAPEQASFDPSARPSAVPTRPAPRRRHRVLRYAAPLLAAAAVAGVAVGLGTAGSHPAANPPAASPTASLLPTAAPSLMMQKATVPPGAKAIAVSSPLQDGAIYGIGMPIVLRFSGQPSDSSAFVKTAKVTVNGRPAGGAWFWEKATSPGAVVEAHYRTKGYWPANATIRVSLPIDGLSAGKGLVYGAAPRQLVVRTGDAHRTVVDCGRGKMTVYANGKQIRSMPASTGKSTTPTYGGVKVVMQKGEVDPATGQLRSDGSVRMVGPGYDEVVPWSVRLTASGEYVLAAPWDTHIGKTDTSNGVTHLTTANARWFYQFSQVGDPLEYQSPDGTKMPAWDGYGDWNVSWKQWSQGGLLHN